MRAAMAKRRERGALRDMGNSGLKWDGTSLVAEFNLI
jgi:hypothetical protein